MYSIPDEINALVFDIDRTLYNNDTYAESQIDVLIDRLAAEFGENKEQTREKIAFLRRQYSEKNNGAVQSLGNIFLELGIPIKKSVQWREELIKPKDYLKPVPVLINFLSGLAENYRLIAVTNNPVMIGQKTLDTIGILPLFMDVIGLDTLMISKPNREIFSYAAEVVRYSPVQMISIGDRYDVDIAPALAAGMGGALVENLDDLYSLSGIL